MQTFKSLEEIVSNKEEYDQLYNTDHLFIIKGKDVDDNNLIGVISNIEHHEWCIKLRGMAEGPAKLNNQENNYQYCHGYIISVSCNKLTKFEKLAMVLSMKHGYTFEKLDLFQTKKELKDNHFDSLFEQA